MRESGYDVLTCHSISIIFDLEENLAKYLTEAQAWKDYHNRNGVTRKPLRSFAEMCSELNVSQATMRGKMGSMNGPKPVYKAGLKHWYEPIEFRKWWEKINE
jgi:hypothetical protein